MLPPELAFLKDWLVWLKTTWAWPGLEEVGRFLGTHLISGMIPAFFIAGAIGVFLDKQRITRLMGPDAPPWISYPLASFSGAILTVCSCGVLPIFTGILQQGAGIGPAFTFLFASPAVNLIALMYTTTYMGVGFTMARLVSVVIVSILIGILMRLVFKDPPPQPAAAVLEVVEDEEGGRTDRQTLVFFGLLVLIMLTSTGVFDAWLKSDQPVIHSPMFTSRMIRAMDFLLSKILLILCEIFVLAFALWRWFHPDEIRQWLKKSWSLFVMIFPTVLLGIFISGLLAALLPLTRYMGLFADNSLSSNLLVAVIGSLMYFGTIVGVNIVATLVHFGMDTGPALTLILSGPAVSLPSVLALQSIVGRAKAFAFLTFVILLTALSGMLYGWWY